MNSQVKGVVPGVMDSTRQNISAAFVPFLDTFLPSLSEGTAKENETKMKHCSLLSMFLFSHCYISHFLLLHPFTQTRVLFITNTIITKFYASKNWFYINVCLISLQVYSLNEFKPSVQNKETMFERSEMCKVVSTIITSIVSTYILHCINKLQLTSPKLLHCLQMKLWKLNIKH